MIGKPRVWDTQNKLMIDPFHVEFIEYDQQVVGVWHKDKGDYYIPLKDAKIMPPVGETDTVNKEVFLGDIVVGYFSYIEETGQWEYGTKMALQTFADYYDISQNSDALEVIGHIYEENEL